MKDKCKVEYTIFRLYVEKDEVTSYNSQTTGAPLQLYTHSTSSQGGSNCLE